MSDKRNFLGIMTIIGLILVLAPINTAIIIFLYSMFRKAEPIIHTSIEGPSSLFIESNCDFGTPCIIGVGAFICGIIVLGFVALIIYRRRETRK